jgi:hypothetical protein
LSTLSSRRLEAQLISRTSFTQLEQVVAWLGAVQAQDYLGALWAVGLRLENAREAVVERALAERRIVRSWPMRGTLHLLAAADARWMTELLAPRTAPAVARRMNALGLDEAILRKARRVLLKRLEGGQRLTRPDAYALLEERGIPTHDQRGLHVLMQLALEGLVCFGPREGKQQTFVLFDEWQPGARLLPRDEALATLAVRYFTSHGPATIEDLAWWSGLTLTDARLAARSAANRLGTETRAGTQYWFDPGGNPRATATDGAFVLPAFDEFLVGYRDRSHALDERHTSRVLGGGIFTPVVVVRGRVAGTWRRTIARGSVVCETGLFGPLGRSRSAAVERALDRYAQFVELPRERGRSNQKVPTAGRSGRR